MPFCVLPVLHWDLGRCVPIKKKPGTHVFLVWTQDLVDP